MLNKLINRIDFAFLISILVSLCGLWLFIHNMILEKSEVEAYSMVISLSVCHYVLTLYTISLVYICLHKSRLMLEDDQTGTNHKIADIVINTFLRTWPYVIAFAILMIIVGLVGFSDEISLAINFLLILIMFLTFLVKIGLTYDKKKILLYMTSSAAVILGYLIFIVLISNASMSLTVKSDKDLYTSSDKEAILIIESQGYMFHPYYHIDKHNNFPKQIRECKGCYAISLEGADKQIFGPCIEVVYQNSMFSSKFLRNFMSKKKRYYDFVYCTPAQ